MQVITVFPLISAGLQIIAAPLGIHREKKHAPLVIVPFLISTAPLMQHFLEIWIQQINQNMQYVECNMQTIQQWKQNLLNCTPWASLHLRALPPLIHALQTCFPYPSLICALTFINNCLMHPFLVFCCVLSIGR